MSLLRLLSLALVLLVTAGCRSIDRDLVSRTKTELAKALEKGRRHEAAPGPGSSIPVPWTKGQFAVWGVTVGEYTTLTEAQIEEADENGYIVMITIISPRVRTTARLTFSHQPRTHDEARDFLTQVIRRRGDERATTYRFHRDMRVDMRDALEPLWATLVPQAVEGPPATAATYAVTLEGCQPGRGQFIYSPLGLELHEAWLHPAVPITGLALGKAKTGETVQLIDLGWSGGGPAL